ncbi:hypothetical protein [Grapevine leafroll-associated virus 3m]|nr:hypothetical protein [Grapevine leafroll-associated virus 3m]
MVFCCSSANVHLTAGAIVTIAILSVALFLLLCLCRRR